MCQSRAEGGRRCAAYTRTAYQKSLAAVLSSRDADTSAAARNAGHDAVVAHAMTPTGRREVDAEADRVKKTRKDYPDGAVTAAWLLQCGFEADEENKRRDAGEGPPERDPNDLMAAFREVFGDVPPRPDPRPSWLRYQEDEAGERRIEQWQATHEPYENTIY